MLFVRAGAEVAVTTAGAVRQSNLSTVSNHSGQGELKSRASAGDAGDPQAPAMRFND